MDTLQEQGKPTTSNNWGWCADWCGGGQSPARTLKVAISSNFLSSVLFDETVIRKKVTTATKKQLIHIQTSVKKMLHRILFALNLIAVKALILNIML